MKPCPFCGAELNGDASFCPYCMRSLIEKVTVTPQVLSKRASRVVLPILLFVFFALVGLIAAFVLNLPSAKPANSIPTSTRTSPTTPSTTIPAKYTSTTNQTTVATTSTANETTLAASSSSSTVTTVPKVTTTTAAQKATTTATKQTTTKPATTKPTASPTTASPFAVQTVEGGVEITGINTTSPDGVYTIPASIGGKTVVGIGNGAFYYNTSIKQMTLPDTLEYIGDQAFYHVNG